MPPVFICFLCDEDRWMNTSAVQTRGGVRHPSPFTLPVLRGCATLYAGSAPSGDATRGVLRDARPLSVGTAIQRRRDNRGESPTRPCPLAGMLREANPLAASRIQTCENLFKYTSIDLRVYVSNASDKAWRGSIQIYPCASSLRLTSAPSVLQAKSKKMK